MCRAAIFATVRTYEISQTVPGIYTFDTFFATILSILEQNVGIVAANVLPMGSLFWKRQAATRMDRRGRTNANANTNAASRNGPEGNRQQNPFESGAASVHSTATRREEFDFDDTESDLGESGLSRPGTSHSSIKRSSMLIIEGPRERDYDERRNRGERNQTQNTRTRSTKVAKHSDTPLRTILNRSASLMSRTGRDRRSTDGTKPTGDEDPNGANFWPRGIIKTVEVEVVEEDIATLDQQLPQHRRLPSNASGVVVTSNPSNDRNHGHGHNRSMSRHSRMDSDNDWAALLRGAAPTPPPGSRGPSRQGSRGPSRQGY